MCNVGILSWEPKLYRTFAVSLCLFTSILTRAMVLRSLRLEEDEEEKEKEKELMPDPRYTHFHHC
jgi:hypothetical protein